MGLEMQDFMSNENQMFQPIITLLRCGGLVFNAGPIVAGGIVGIKNSNDVVIL
jgi:hypothetical protein